MGSLRRLRGARRHLSVVSMLLGVVSALFSVVSTLVSVGAIDTQVAPVVRAGEFSILEGAADCIECPVGDRLPLRIDGGVPLAMIVVPARVTTLVAHVLPSVLPISPRFPPSGNPLIKPNFSGAVYEHDEN